MIVVVCFKVVLYFRELKIMMDSLNNISCLLDTIHDNLFLNSTPPLFGAMPSSLQDLISLTRDGT